MSDPGLASFKVGWGVPDASMTAQSTAPVLYFSRSPAISCVALPVIDTVSTWPPGRLPEKGR
jgi:hypothetical protein